MKRTGYPRYACVRFALIRLANDAWLTKMAFRFMLIKRAYTQGEFIRMVEESRFDLCQINAGPIGFEVRFNKPARSV
jgi:hypothetical protein